MFRKNLIKLLLENPMSLRQIARMEEELPDRIADDLNHLFRSLKHTEYEAVIEPARCRARGFEFSESKLNKPPNARSAIAPGAGTENWHQAKHLNPRVDASFR